MTNDVEPREPIALLASKAILLCVIALAISVGAIGFALYATLDASQALKQENATRLSSSTDRCEQIEELKVDARAVFKKFGITAAELPIVYPGTPREHIAFAAIKGTCREQSVQLASGH